MKKGIIIAVIIGIALWVPQTFRNEFEVKKEVVYDLNNTEVTGCLAMIPQCGYCPESTDQKCYDDVSVPYKGFPFKYYAGGDKLTFKPVANMLIFVSSTIMIYLLYYKLKKLRK